jgi:hypothetical protein
MKRLVRLYPRQWRARYGAELEAFLESEPISIRLVLDLVRGILGAYLQPDLGMPRFAFAGPGGARAFLPEVGFRQHGVKLARPVSLERDGRKLTVYELICTPEGVDLMYDLTTSPAELTPRSDVPGPELVALREGGREHRTDFIRSSGGNASTEQAGKIVRRVLLRADPPLPTPMSALELQLSGPAFGDWSLHVDLVPFPSGADVPAPQVDASDSREGITLTVRSVALSDDTTAIELQASTSAFRLHGIGGFLGLREGTTALTLRDQNGRSYAERVRARPRDQFPGSPRSGAVAVFDRLDEDARELELEVPFVCVDEMEHEVEVELPVSRPTDLHLGPYPIRMLASRRAESTDPSAPGPTLVLEFDLLGWHGDRRILTFARPINVDGECPGGSLRGPAMKAGEPQPMHTLEIPLKDPSAARRLTLAGPTVQVRGPWRIRFERPRVSPS